MVTARYPTLPALCVLLALATGCASINAPPGWLPTAAETQTDAYGGWVEIKLEYPVLREDISERGIVTRQRAKVREGYEEGSPLLARLVRGTVVPIVENRGDSYRIEMADGEHGWIWAQDMVIMTSDDELRGELIAVGQDSIFVIGHGGFAAVPIAFIKKGTLIAYDPDAGAFALWTVMGVASTASHGYGLLLTMPAWIIVGTATTAVETHVSKHRTKNVWWGMRKFARFPHGLPPSVDRSTLKTRRWP